MLVLSLATLVTGLFQFLASPSPREASLIDVFDFSVVAIFAVEYTTGLSSADERSAYVRAPTNLLSLAIILLAAAGALFSLPILLSAPILRLVRAARLFGEAGDSSVELAT